MEAGEAVQIDDGHEEENLVWPGAVLDDMSGEALGPTKVALARKLEIDYVNGKQVWTKCAEKRRISSEGK